jgi:hypothetical protein
MRLSTAALVLFVSLLSVPKADAAPITWKFTGEVTRINHFQGTDPFSLGSLVSFTATFDSGGGSVRFSWPRVLRTAGWHHGRGRRLLWVESELSGSEQP